MSLGGIFPGQGSQSVGMLAQLGAQIPSITERFTEASDVINEPLADIIVNGPEELLNRTDITQPAVLTASIALWEAWQARGGATPQWLAGHSLGEYTALVCGGAMTFADGVRLVNLRGRYMQDAVPLGEGAVAAVLGLDDAQVEACCAQAPGIVTPANYNAPGQVAIAGAATAVNAAIEACKSAGAKRAVLLKVSVPVHSPLMEPAGERLMQALTETTITMPQIPVVHNVDGEVASSIEQMLDKLLAQLAQPVQWTKCIQQMVAQGVTQLTEFGPGKVLAGLVKRIDRSIRVANIDTPESFEQSLQNQLQE